MAKVQRKTPWQVIAQKVMVFTKSMDLLMHFVAQHMHVSHGAC